MSGPLDLPKREWVYVQRPKEYEIAGCPHCGNDDPDWSEYAHRLWCPVCKIDFIPEHDAPSVEVASWMSWMVEASVLLFRLPSFRSSDFDSSTTAWVFAAIGVKVPFTSIAFAMWVCPWASL